MSFELGISRNNLLNARSTDLLTGRAEPLRRLLGSLVRSFEHQMPDLAHRLGAAEQKSLDLLATFPAEELQVLLALDSLRHDRDVEAAAEAQHRADDRD